MRQHWAEHVSALAPGGFGTFETFLLKSMQFLCFFLLFTEEICVERGSDRLRVESCTYVTASLADPLHACHELTFKIFLIDFEI